MMSKLSEIFKITNLIQHIHKHYILYSKECLWKLRGKEMNSTLQSERHIALVVISKKFQLNFCLHVSLVIETRSKR